MKWLLVLLVLMLALLCGWWLVTGTSDGAGLRPNAALVPTETARSPDALPAVSSASQARTRTTRAEVAAETAEPTAGGVAVASGSNSEEFVFFRARLRNARGEGLHEGTLSLPFLNGGITSSEFQEGWLTLKQTRSHLTDAPLQFRVDAPGYASVLFQRSWEGLGVQHVGELVLQRGSRVSGRVFDAAGNPAANALVRAAQVERYVDDGYRHQRELRGPRLGKYGTGPGFLRSEAAFLTPETHADASGSFTFDTVPRAWVQVWARSAESRWAWSKQVAIHPDRPVRDLQLNLPAVAAEDWIRGVLLDPDGAPVAFHEIQAKAIGRSTTSRCITDKQGRFKLAAADGGSRDLTATPGVWEWDAAHAPAVPAGSEKIVLQFSESEWLWVHVTDSSGQPITRGRVSGIRTDSTFEARLPRVVSDLWDDGRARLHAPREDFDLMVHADGYESARSGPHSWGANERIDVVMEKLRGLRVTVTFDGRPVPGAQLRLRSVAREGKEFAPSWDGEGPPLAQDLMPQRSGYSLADSTGEALLSISGKDTVTWRLIASGEGRAAAYSAVVTKRDAEEQRHIEIALPRPGSLRGVLELTGQASAEGWTVAVCDGLGITRKTIVRSSGGYAFDSLHAGPWQVRALRPGQKLWDNGLLRDRQARQTDVEIVASTQATYDFTPPARVVARLRGRLSIPGHEFGPWNGAVERNNFEFDEAGAFALEGLAPGEYRLHFSSTDPRWSHLHFTESIRLTEGDNWWERDLALGTIALSIDASEDDPQPANPTRVWIELQDEDLRLSAYLTPQPGAPPGEFLLPVGKYLLKFRIPSFGGPTGPERPFIPFEIRAGETVELDL